jgi:hypothetical protein
MTAALRLDKAKDWLEAHHKRDRNFPYRGWQRVAYWLKVRLQMLIGAYAVFLIIKQSTFTGHGPRLLEAKESISLIGNGLAMAAVIELAYTLFTPGPDEALDPLMLGLSAALLIVFADPEKFTSQNALAAFLFIFGLAILFGIRQWLEHRHRKLPDDHEGSGRGGATS